MAATAALIPELEDVIQYGTPERRAETLRRITSLFLDGAGSFNEGHVALFGDVIGCLIDEIEAKTLAELARNLAPVSNSPGVVIQKLARHDDIDVAGPVLEHSRLDEKDLLQIAETKSQAHLLALSTRRGIGEALSDVLVRRGDRNVARSVATNQDAKLSEGAFTALIKRAEDDGVLAEKVGMRTDIPPRLFRELLLKATEVVQERLLAQAKPETQAEIRRVLAKVSGEVGVKAAPRNFLAAMSAVRELHKQGKLTESELVRFAQAGKYEETIASLSVLCAVPIEVVDRLMAGERPDPVLILGRAAGFKWDTVRSIISSRPGARNSSSQFLDGALENFEKLTMPTAQRVVRFWQVRQGV
jgi:uncharacterized protein (DUF2336 family)